MGIFEAIKTFFTWWLIFQDGDNVLTFYGKSAIIMFCFTFFLVLILVIYEIVRNAVIKFSNR